MNRGGNLYFEGDTKYVDKPSTLNAIYNLDVITIKITLEVTYNMYLYSHLYPDLKKVRLMKKTKLLIIDKYLLKIILSSNSFK